MLKEIEGFKDYFVSDDGFVYSKKSGELVKLKSWLDGKGKYLTVSLCKDGKNYKKQVHRLVALHFIDNPNNYPEVNHLNYDSTDNKVENLEWTTRKGNMNHCFKKYSPVRNYKRCILILNGENIGFFQSINEACRYASKHLGASYSSLNRNRKFKNIRIITQETETTIPEGSSE